MRSFFDQDLFLSTDAAKRIYAEIRDLPIIDYHCHLDAAMIEADARFSDLGELWLAGDHYKWRAMRMCGIDEAFITGEESFERKLEKYAEVLPKIPGNALYYFSHMELERIFGIREPLTPESVARVRATANEKLASLSVRSLLRDFRVEYIATTDDPTDSLSHHGTYGETRVCPTFRPDKIYALEDGYLSALAKASGIATDTLSGVLEALQNRLDFFVSRGCRISDHGFSRFPKHYADRAEAEALCARRKTLSEEERDAIFGFLLLFLTREYKKRGILMQIHFNVVRNNNPEMLRRCGVDAGFDLIDEEQSVRDLIAFLAKTPDEERPETVLYTLNDNNLSALAAVTGAFRHVRMGAAWWFNDTKNGILRNLDILGEYAALGTHLGMLTDSRSFASYVRFDFFRRLLAEHLGALVDRGEYDEASAVTVARDVAYFNIKKLLCPEESDT